MKNEELIEVLSNFDGNTEVIISYAECDYDIEKISYKAEYINNKKRKEKLKIIFSI